MNMILEKPIITEFLRRSPLPPTSDPIELEYQECIQYLIDQLETGGRTAKVRLSDIFHQLDDHRKQFDGLVRYIESLNIVLPNKIKLNYSLINEDFLEYRFIMI